MDAAHDAPLVQQLGEAKGDARWPSAGTLLRLPEPPVVVLHVKPAGSGAGVVVRLLNASDTEQQAEIGSALLNVRAAAACDLLENETGSLPVNGGAVTVSIPPRRVAVVRLTVE
jgi:alpha-mannosidase